MTLRTALFGLGFALLCAAGVGAKPTAVPVTQEPEASTAVKAPSHRPYHATRPTEGAKNYYATFWGITDLRVRLTSSDEQIGRAHV